MPTISGLDLAGMLHCKLSLPRQTCIIISKSVLQAVAVRVPGVVPVVVHALYMYMFMYVGEMPSADRHTASSLKVIKVHQQAPALHHCKQDLSSAANSPKQCAT